jgi:hypothetical protein
VGGGQAHRREAGRPLGAQGRAGPSDPQAARGGAAARRGDGETAGGVNAGKSKRELYEDAKRAGIEGRSEMTKDELVDALQRHSRRETARARR